MPARCFNEYIDAEFEGKNFLVFKDYDTMLSLEYGDYMTPTPVNEIVYYPVHEISFPADYDQCDKADLF